MKQNTLPPGWTDEKAQRVIAYYEDQSEDEALVEDAAAVEPSETVMNVPHNLVSKVRELIAKRNS